MDAKKMVKEIKRRYSTFAESVSLREAGQPLSPEAERFFSAYQKGSPTSIDVLVCEGSVYIGAYDSQRQDVDLWTCSVAEAEQALMQVDGVETHRDRRKREERAAEEAKIRESLQTWRETYQRCVAILTGLLSEFRDGFTAVPEGEDSATAALASEAMSQAFKGLNWLREAARSKEEEDAWRREGRGGGSAGEREPFSWGMGSVGSYQPPPYPLERSYLKEVHPSIAGLLKAQRLPRLQDIVRTDEEIQATGFSRIFQAAKPYLDERRRQQVAFARKEGMTVAQAETWLERHSVSPRLAKIFASLAYRFGDDEKGRVERGRFMRPWFARLEGTVGDEARETEKQALIVAYIGEARDLFSGLEPEADPLSVFLTSLDKEGERMRSRKAREQLERKIWATRALLEETVRRIEFPFEGDLLWEEIITSHGLKLLRQELTHDWRRFVSRQAVDFCSSDLEDIVTWIGCEYAFSFESLKRDLRDDEKKKDRFSARVLSLVGKVEERVAPVRKQAQERFLSLMDALVRPDL